MTKRYVLFICLLMLSAMAKAGWDEGVVALLKEWQPLAEQGNADAQNGMGVIYSAGLGVQKNVPLTQAKFEEGINERTGGVMLKSDGNGLGVEGLSGFSAIFDKNQTLVGVVMMLPKDVNGMYAKLAEKYQPVEKNIDSFMGNGSAKFGKGDSLVIMAAPHLSFAMEVTYVTKGFLDEASKKAEAEAAEKAQDQKNKL